MTASSSPAAGAAAPVFLWDPEARDLRAFGSAVAAARALRPWQEVSGFAAWDAEGRAVAFAVAARRVRRLGLWPATREVVEVRAVEESPAHAADLRQALLAALGRRGRAPAAPAALPLAELVALAAPLLRR